VDGEQERTVYNIAMIQEGRMRLMNHHHHHTLAVSAAGKRVCASRFHNGENAQCM